MELLPTIRCPQTGQRVVRQGDFYISENGAAFSILRNGTHELPDLRPHDLAEASREQRSIYNDSASRYGADHSHRPDFVRDFVHRFRSGAVKNKDALLRRWFLELARRDPNTILEIGCNDGRFLQVATELASCRGVGIDIAEEPLWRAVQQNLDPTRVAFLLGDAARLPLADESFDAIVAMDVFEHLGHSQLRRCIEECSRVMRRGGTLLAYVVSRKDEFTFHATLRALTSNRMGVDDKEGHCYENFVHPDEMREMCRSAGMSVDRVVAHHGFWTLFAEEVLANRLPKSAFPLLRIIDWPLVRAEYGNGFLALIRKP